MSESVGDELVVLDTESNVAHCLSPAAAGVWQLCDGHRNRDAIAAVTGQEPELVDCALAELEHKGLLVSRSEPAPAPGVSRRFALKRIGAGALAASSAPLIYSAAIRTPLAHASALQCGACDNMSNPCQPGFTCDPTNSVCISSNCNFQSCTVGNHCSQGIAVGTCQPGCSTGGTICCV